MDPGGFARELGWDTQPERRRGCAGQECVTALLPRLPGAVTPTLMSRPPGEFAGSRGWLAAAGEPESCLSACSVGGRPFPAQLS